MGQLRISGVFPMPEQDCWSEALGIGRGALHLIVKVEDEAWLGIRFIFNLLTEP